MHDRADTPSLTPGTLAARHQLIALGARYHRAGWLFGTSGNLSARVTTELDAANAAEGDTATERIVVTASGRDKGHLGPEDFVELDLAGELLAAGHDVSSDPIRGPSAASGSARCRPSAESTIHLAIYRTRPDTRVALHVHTVASTLTTPDGSFPASDSHAPVPRRTFKGLELIKGWDLWDEHAVAHLPIFPNWPEVPRIARDIEAFYRANSNEPVPALLITSHGITAWGKDAFSANRHLEVAEFLCQVALARSER